MESTTAKPLRKVSGFSMQGSSSPTTISAGTMQKGNFYSDMKGSLQSSPPILKQRTRYGSPSVITTTTPLTSLSNTPTAMPRSTHGTILSRIFSIAPTENDGSRSQKRKESIGFLQQQQQQHQSQQQSGNNFYSPSIMGSVKSSRLQPTSQRINLLSKSEQRREAANDTTFSGEKSLVSISDGKTQFSASGLGQSRNGYVSEFNAKGLNSVKEEEEGAGLTNVNDKAGFSAISLSASPNKKQPSSAGRSNWKVRAKISQDIAAANFKWSERKLADQFRIHEQSIRRRNNNNNRRGSMSVSSRDDLVYLYNPHVHHMKMSVKDAGIQQAFKKVSGVQELQSVKSVRSTKGALRSYMQRRYGDRIVEKILSFLEVPQKIDFISYTQILEKLLNLSHKEKTLLLFIVFDDNDDGYVCNTDLFSHLKRNRNAMIEADIRQIIRFAQTRLNGIADLASDDNETENIMVKKPMLTLTEYKLLKKKGQDQVIPTSVKKDTLYSNSFYIIEHSFNYRQSVQQLEDEKVSQMMDEKKNRVRECRYNERDHSFALNFDQFEVYMQSLSHFPYVFFDLIAYLALLRFDHVQFPVGYDKEYYASFVSFSEEAIQFKSLFVQLLNGKKKQQETQKKEVRAKQVLMLNQAQEIIQSSKRQPSPQQDDAGDVSPIFKGERKISDVDEFYLL